LRSAPLGHEERERMLTEIEIRFGLDLELLTPRVIYFCEVLSNSISAAVVRAADGCKQRMELDLLIAYRDRAFYVPDVERSIQTAVELDVSLGHALSLGRGELAVPFKV
jgi:hypothetical protein